jgi:hypothetical protein
MQADPYFFIPPVEEEKTGSSVSKFIVPDWGIKLTTVVVGTGPPACSLTGRFDNPLPKLTLSPQSGTMNLASDLATPVITIEHGQKST